MRLITVALVASASVALAQSHERRHEHHHAHRVKRDDATTTHIVYAPGETVFIYVFNGQPISEDEVQEGIRNGTLKLGDDGAISSAAASTTVIEPAVFAEAFTSSSSSETPSPSPSSSETPSSSPTPTPTPTPTSTPTPSSSAAPESSAAATSSASSGSSSSGATGINADFDETLSCNTFPSAYGAVSLDYLGLGGWSGIQNPGYSGSDGYNNIETMTNSICGGSGCCGEGMFCSYACPAGYQKTQWPSNQGVTGQSVGGLRCSNGKLKLTRGDVTKKLCEKGTTKVSIKVKNTMSKGAAVCRTDYPGTESETIPVWASSGGEADLACPDGATYYQKDGNPTSAQYYVNNAGISVEKGCQWGDGSEPIGNWAPLNIGVGYSSGKGWISIFQNAPTTDAKLDFTVEIEGDDLSGKCRYSGGKYCSGDNYQNCNTKDGCTVAVNSGTAYFVFS